MQGRPARVVVDRRGLNYYDLPVQPARNLGWWRSIEPAHLRPSNGGGRVLSLSDYSVTAGLQDSTPVTFVVENRTVRRSVTVSKEALDPGRVYLVRTEDGLVAMTDPPLAPMNISTPGGYADRRFVANATFTVVVDGVPVERTRLPKRVTRASDTPLSELTTGVSMRLADDPSDLPERYQDDPGDYDWTDHTVLYLHNWNYETLVVSGASNSSGGNCPLDNTCFYRISDGTKLRIETADGTVLFEDTVDGNRTVAP